MPPLDLDDPEVKAEVQKLVNSAVETEVSSLKSKNQEIIDEKRNLQKSLEAFKDVDVDTFKKFQAHFESSEDAKLIAEGKLDDVINRRVDKVRNEIEDKLTDATSALELTKTERDLYANKYSDHVIEIELRRAAEKEGVAPQAIDDVILRGQGKFHVEDDGSVTMRDGQGNVLKHDGKTATPESFVTGLKETAPHYWPQSTGPNLDGGFSEGSDALKALQKAASSGNMEEYRRLRAEGKKNQS